MPCCFGDDVEICIDPAKDGNCQFYCIAHELSRLAGYGVWSCESLRNEVVMFLENSQCWQNVDIKEFVPHRDLSKYTERMKQSGTFGDHVTLQAAAQRFNVHIFVLSSRGHSYARLITGISTDTGAVPTILLGHTGVHGSEDLGGHYVILKPVGERNVSDIISSRLSRADQYNARSAEDALATCEEPVPCNSQAEDTHHFCEAVPEAKLNEATIPADTYERMCEPNTTLATSATSYPKCLSLDQFLKKKSDYPWLLAEKGKLGCQHCRDVSALGPHRTQGVRISTEWATIKICFYGQTRKQQLQSLRKKIYEHENSAAHKATTNILYSGAEKRLEKSAASATKEFHGVTCRIFRTAYMIAKCGRPFTDIKHNVELQQLNGIELGRTLHSNVTCSNITDHIAEEMRQKTANYIIQNKCKVSILIDESTTLSRKTTLIIFMRAAVGDPNDPQTFYLDLVELNSTTSDSIYASLLSCLTSYGFTTEFLSQSLICIATDGASAMLGKQSGVCAKLVSQFPHIVVWHCSNHRLELSVHDTVEEVAGVNHFHIFFDKLYSLYHQSPKAQRELEHCCKLLHERCFSIGRILNTRWVASSLRTVNAVWSQYEALHKHMQEAASDTSRSSSERAQYSGLLKKLTTTQFVLNLGLLRDALTELADVSLLLQKQDMTLPQAHQLLSRQVRVFRSMIDKPGRYASECRLAASTKKFHNVDLTPGTKSDILIRHEQFFASLAVNFERRLLTTRASGRSDSTDENEYAKLLTGLQSLDPETWPPNCDVLYGEDHIAELCQRFSVEERRSIQGLLCNRAFASSQ